MAYQFLFGASGAGKSYELHKRVLEKALPSMRAFSGTQYLLIVPDQFSMQTQKDLVRVSPVGGILNVDVLSFGRLSHRVFEEVGESERITLDDTGKSLILARLSGKIKKELPVIGKSLTQQGTIAEVKSILSEFMQYGLSPEDIEKLAEYSENRGALKARLLDLKRIYEEFVLYEKEQFVTTEEKLDLFKEAIPKSELIRNSVICFDGFTGFTPVQIGVIGELMRCAKNVVFSLTYSEDGGKSMEEVLKDRDPGEEQALFYLTRKTVVQIADMADRMEVPHGKDVDLNGTSPYRFRDNKSLIHLEKNLFRHPLKPMEDRGFDTSMGSREIMLYEASSPYEEVRQMFIRMKKLIEEKGYAWRDFAILAGDLSSYEDPVRRLSILYNVPVYFDKTRAILHNPLTETLRAAISIRMRDFSYETVFRYLRAGLSGFTMEEADLFENYCLAHGIHGRKRYELSFDADFEPMRLKLLESLKPFLDLSHATAEERSRAALEFLELNGIEELMSAKADGFEEAGDRVRADEYRQIYGKVTDLLTEIKDLLGDEKISLEDYLRLLDAGIGEIRLGTLPQQADIVMAGDLERSRFSEVKVLFVLGANDGNIPKGTGKGGIISDLDREFLAKSGIVLAPTPREEMFIQRMYIYLGLTKPKDMLFVSFADTDAAGTSLRPSYLISLMQKLFPFLCPGGEVPRPEENGIISKITGEEDTLPFLAEGLRLFSEGRYENESKEDKDPESAGFYTLYGTVLGMGSEDLKAGARKLAAASFLRYEPKPLSKKAAAGLYGDTLRGSVSRLEKTAQCYKRQFLEYGMNLQERDEYVFRPQDFGSVMHESLDAFEGELVKRGLTWKSFDKEEGRKIAKEMIRRTAEVYGNRVLFSTAKGEYMMTRMQDILGRTIDTLQFQIVHSSFEPLGTEVGFGGVTYPAGSGKMVLGGRIDRVDLAEGKDGDLYVKIVDYKSGGKDLDIAKMRDGRQLQLMVYMSETLKKMEKQNPGRKVHPAALFYYHLSDPFIKEDGKKDLEDIRKKELRPKGLLVLDGEAISLLDSDSGTQGPSLSIPVSYLKGGGVSERTGNALPEEEMKGLEKDVLHAASCLGAGILQGNVETKPFKDRKEDACAYCPYADVCGFDRTIPGYGTKDRNIL